MIWIKRLNQYGVPNLVILLLLSLSFLSMLAQMIGLGIFLPIFDYIFQIDSATLSEKSDNFLLKYVNILIDSFGLESTLENLLIVAFLFYLLSQITLFIIAYTNAYYFGRMIQTIRNKFFEYYLDADTEYYDKVKIGDFINTSTSELGLAVIGVMAPIKLVVSFLSAIGSLIILLMLSIQLTFFILLVVLIMLPYPIYLISNTTKFGRDNTEYNSKLVAFLLDRLRSPRLVRLSGTRNSEIKEYTNIVETQRKLSLKIHVLKEKIGLTFEPAMIFSSLIILYIAIEFLALSSSAVILFMVITVRLVPIVRAILVQQQSINKNKGPMESIDLLLFEMYAKSESKQKNKNIEIENFRLIESIELKDVTYNYSSSESNAISGVSLIFKKETLNAIIGPSGSGKSTLIDIISTYRKPNSGEIVLDGMPFSGSEVNNLVSYVPQDPQMFDGKIMDHISYGLNFQSLNEIKKATKLSGAHDFIMKFDNQYETVLNNNADNLSGGQRYRIDIARALLSDTPIIILDEPTSALDYENKSYFLKILKNIKKDTKKIVIVITHDFSILPIFDNILIMKNGKLVSQSSHDDLVENDAWYKNGFNHNNGE